MNQWPPIASTSDFGTDVAHEFLICLHQPLGRRRTQHGKNNNMTSTGRRLCMHCGIVLFSVGGGAYQSL